MRCSMCDKEITAGYIWAGLNRVAVGVGGRVRLLEFEGKGGGYHWDMKTGKASGSPLCWPHCFMTFVEGMQIELQHDVRTEHGRTD